MEQPNRLKSVHKWVRRGFLAWATFVLIYLGNSVRTQGVPPQTLKSNANCVVTDFGEVLQFEPTEASQKRRAGVIFLCGSGIDAKAYAPLLRPLADDGYPVRIVRLPWRFAPFESHKLEACARAHRILNSTESETRWVLAGHSLGGALACQVVEDNSTNVAALVLVATTHPKRQDLSKLSLETWKVYGTNDRIAPFERMKELEQLLPNSTTWVEVPGANHSQFGNYGHQLSDGKATLTREDQQEQTRSVLFEALRYAEQDAPVKEDR